MMPYFASEWLDKKPCGFAATTNLQALCDRALVHQHYFKHFNQFVDYEKQGTWHPTQG